MTLEFLISGANFLILGVLFVFFLYNFMRIELRASFVYTALFIFAIWVNLPCFIPAPSDSNVIINIPFLLYKKTNFAYTFLVNCITCCILFFIEHYLHPDYISYKKLKSKYDSFVSDASELYIIGRDLDFLDKEEFDEQTNRIKHLGAKAKLLCEESSDPHLLDLYDRIKEHKVDIRTYKKSDDLTNLKGQIKIDQSGHKAAIFSYRKQRKDSRDKELYRLEEINNQYLVNVIIKLYDNYFLKQKEGTA